MFSDLHDFAWQQNADGSAQRKCVPARSCYRVLIAWNQISKELYFDRHRGSFSVYLQGLDQEKEEEEDQEKNEEEDGLGEVGGVDRLAEHGQVGAPQLAPPCPVPADQGQDWGLHVPKLPLVPTPGDPAWTPSLQIHPPGVQGEVLIAACHMSPGSRYPTSEDRGPTEGGHQVKFEQDGFANLSLDKKYDPKWTIPVQYVWALLDPVNCTVQSCILRNKSGQCCILICIQRKCGT